VGAVDNGGTLVAPFIGKYDDGRRAIKEREAVAVEPQRRRLQEMEIDKGGCWSVAIFKWEEGEEARQLHDVGGE
jgi:hypothetical protein